MRHISSEHVFGEDDAFKFGVFDGIPSLVRAVVSTLDFG